MGLTNFIKIILSVTRRKSTGDANGHTSVAQNWSR